MIAEGGGVDSVKVFSLVHEGLRERRRGSRGRPLWPAGYHHAGALLCSASFAGSVVCLHGHSERLCLPVQSGKQ